MKVHCGIFVVMLNGMVSPLVTDIKQLERHDTFLQMELVKEVYPKLQEQLYAWLRQGKFTTHLPVKKLAYNDRKLGVFSFARAAMGLQKNFTIYTTPPVKRLQSQIRLALGQAPWRTTVKATHAFFSSKPQNRPMFRFYLLAGGHAARSGQSLYYTGIGLAVLIDFLQAYQIATEVYVIHAAKVRTHIFAAITKVKAAEHPLDLNQLLLLGSDPRFFRYQGFLTLISVAQHYKLQIPESLGKFPSDLGHQILKELPQEGILFEQHYSLQATLQAMVQLLQQIENQTTSTSL